MGEVISRGNGWGRNCGGEWVGEWVEVNRRGK